MVHREQPDYYAEPSHAAAPYGDSDPYDPYDSYDTYGPYDRAPAAMPWSRRPLALVAAGAIGMVVLALAAYGLVMLVGGHSIAPNSTTSGLP